MSEIMARDIAAPLLSVENLKVHFAIRSGVLQRQVGEVKAVDGVSFSIGSGETLGLVGESGCGKSTTGLALMGLVKATDGRIAMQGAQDVTGMRSVPRAYRRRMQIIFQDPFSSLNPASGCATLSAHRSISMISARWRSGGQRWRS